MGKQMKCKIIRTDKSDELLREIIFYLAVDLGSIDITLKYLEKMEKSINSFEDLPMSDTILKYFILRK